MDRVESPLIHVDVPPATRRSERVADVPMVERIVSPIAELSSAEVFPMTDDAVDAKASTWQKIGPGPAESKHTSVHLNKVSNESQGEYFKIARVTKVGLKGMAVRWITPIL